MCRKFPISPDKSTAHLNALEGRLRNGGRYDKRTKQQIIKLRQDGYGYYHRFLSGPDEKPSVRLLPQGQSDRHQSGCAYRGKAGTELLPQLWQTSDADTGPKACEILLRCLPHSLVEHPSGQGQPQSLLFALPAPAAGSHSQPMEMTIENTAPTTATSQTASRVVIAMTEEQFERESCIRPA